MPVALSPRLPPAGFCPSETPFTAISPRSRPSPPGAPADRRFPRQPRVRNATAQRGQQRHSHGWPYPCVVADKPDTRSGNRCSHVAPLLSGCRATGARLRFSSGSDPDSVTQKCCRAYETLSRQAADSGAAVQGSHRARTRNAHFRIHGGLHLASAGSYRAELDLRKFTSYPRRAVMLAPDRVHLNTSAPAAPPLA